MTTVALALLTATGGPQSRSADRLGLVLLAGAAVLVAQRRLRRFAAASAGLGVGLAGLAGGLGAGVSSAVHEPWSASSVLGALTLAAALPLVVLASARLIGRVGWWRRLLAVPIALAALALVVGPLTLAVFVTHAPAFPPTTMTPADRGLRYHDVELLTDDHVRLAGQYVSSGNGAAVLVLGGISGIGERELDVAAVLARHGFGVLLLDVRGQGASAGDAMLWGWWGEVDVAAGVEYLSRRPDVVDARIGAIGMSVGGEQAISAAGTDHRLLAVVSEGATARGARDEGDPARGIGGLLTRYVDWTSRTAASLMSGAPRPAPLRGALAALHDDQRALLIAAGTAEPEIAATEAFRAAAPDRVEVWVVPAARHIGALRLDPETWERRVVAFLDAALAPVDRAAGPVSGA